VAVWGDHHRDLDALIPNSGDAPSPFAFDGGSSFETKAKLGEERDDGIEGFHYDADVVHPLDGHIFSILMTNDVALIRPSSHGSAVQR
jgi:hypothetical protein